MTKDQSNNQFQQNDSADLNPVIAPHRPDGRPPANVLALRPGEDETGSSSIKVFTHMPSTESDWTELISVEDPILPPFPVSAIPTPLGDWVEAVAEATQTPPDVAGLLGLAYVGAAAARNIEIELLPGYVEPINIYVAALLEPGNRKSAVFSFASAPLAQIEGELRAAAAPSIARMRAQRAIKETAQKTAVRNAAKGDLTAADDAQRLAEELALMAVTPDPQLIIDDTTAEAIEVALACQGGRIMLSGAEGGVFDIVAGRYSGGASNIDILLKGHQGDTLRVDRVIRGGLRVVRPCVSAAFALQPDVIKGLADKQSFRGRGLIGRFLFAVPKSPLGNRKIDTPPVPPCVKADYENLIRRVFDIKPISADVPHLLQLSPAARSRFRDWMADVEIMLGEWGRLELVKDWGGKLCGLTGRLIAILHLVSNNRPEPWLDPVDLKTVESAIELARWAIPHAEAAIGLMSRSDDALNDAAYILKWLRRLAKPTISRRQIHEHGRQRFDGARERLDRALEELVECGWLRPLLSDKPRVGRPSTQFEVHPNVWRDAMPSRLNDQPCQAGSVAPPEQLRLKGVL